MADAYVKTPAGKLTYTWDWAPWLAEITDTIASATAAIAEGDGLTLADTDFTTTTVTVRLEDSVVGETYRIDCTITTAGTLVDQDSMFLTIVEYR